MLVDENSLVDAIVGQIAEPQRAEVVALFLREGGAKARLADENELLHVCCGHDFWWLLGLALRNHLSNKGGEITCRDEVESDLRLCYHWIHFQATDLAKRLLAWASLQGSVFRFA